MVHWTEANTPGTYLVMLRYSPGDTISVDTVVGDTAQVVSLPRVNRYYVEVRQLCSGTWTDSEWDTFENDYSCGRPQGIAVDSAADSTAVLTIADTVGTDHLVVLTHGYYTDTIVPTGLQFTLTGLMPATQYTVRVYNRCTDSTLSDYVSTSFATACSMVTHAELPYVETFDGCIPGSVNTLSPCWTIRSFAPSNYVGLYRPDNNQYHGASGNSLYADAPQPDWPMFIALPEVDSLDDLMLNLWVYCGWAGDSKIDFGIMSNPADTTTFQVIDTYIPAVERQWVDVSVPFRGYGGVGHYPAMRVGVANGTIGDAFYLDDITLTYNLSCAQPDSLGIGSISDTSAMLTIVPSADADSDAVAYHVVLSSRYGNDTMIVTATTLTITGLVPATDYEFEVRSECPEGGLTTAAHAQFRTDCGAYQLPYFEDFEYQDEYQIPRCWELMDTILLQVAVQNADTIVTIFSSKVMYTEWTLLEFNAATGVFANGGRFVITILNGDTSHYRTVLLNIDDVSIEAACLPVAGLEVVTSDTVPVGLTANRTPRGIESEWLVHVWNSNSFIYIPVTQPWIVLTDIALLHDSTDYWLTVRPICGEGDTGDWSDTVAFRTPDPYTPEGISQPVRVPRISVHPNPASGVAVVELGGVESRWTLTVIDAAGRMVREVKAGSDSLVHLDVSTMDPGVYFLRASGTDTVGKLVVR